VVSCPVGGYDTPGVLGQALARSLQAANRAKDEFLAMPGHELRNPLATLTNAVAVLERLDGDDTMRHVVAIITPGTWRASSRSSTTR
jgi:signal transduction histidine kinase